MIIETNLQPNCSETAFKVYTDKLSRKKAAEVMKYVRKKLKEIAGIHGRKPKLRKDKWVRKREGFIADDIDDKSDIWKIAEFIREKFDMPEEDVETIRDDCYDDLMDAWKPSVVEQFAQGEYKKK